jgi:hypothetical protein
MRQLGVAHQIGFKIWRLSRQLQLALSVAVLIVLGLLCYRWVYWSDLRVPTLTLGELLVILVLLAGVQFGLPLLRRWHLRKTLQEILIGIGMATVGFLARISQRGRCIGALDLRKSSWTNGLSQDQGESRCRQSVARICLALHQLKGGRW